MPWRQQGDGGSGGGGGGGPWGGGGRGTGGGGGGGSQPPNFEDLFRKGRDRFKGMMPGGFKSPRTIILLVVAGIALWLLSGFYRVQPDEQGVVLRFGQWVRTAQAGLNYHLPSPIESVIKPKVTRINRIEIGVRTLGEGTRGGARDVPEESLMLTGDENIIDIDFTVFWQIRDAGEFLFNIRSSESTVKVAAESAMREVVGRTNIQSVLTEGRQQVERQTATRLQEVLDSYKAGITVNRIQLLKVDPPQQVIDAFIDVQRARADRDRARNEAETYSKDILPRARGEAERLVQEARGYKEAIINQSQGEAQRFTEVYEAYKTAKDVTAQRIYIETLEEVFRGMTKIIMDSGAKGGQGIVPYLPLPELQRRRVAPPPPSAPAPTAPAVQVQPRGTQR